MAENIQVDGRYIADALAHEREVARRHDELHVAQNDLNRFVAHMRVLHNVPEDYVLRDWLAGFEPAGGNGDGDIDNT